MRPVTIEAAGLSRRALRLALAFASVAAGVIHAVAAPHHLDEAPPLGAAFVAVAVFQVLWALPAISSSDRRVFDVAAIVNAAIVLAWIVSRTVGLPVGPHAWIPEAPGNLDVSATVLELVIVAGSLLGAPEEPVAGA
jgi:hypothetical protein